MTNIQSSMESAVERQVVARPRHPLLWALAQGTGIGLLLAPPVRYWQPAVFPPWALLVGLTVALAVVAVIDETTRRIPNTHTALLLAAGAVLTIQTAVLNSPTAALTSVAAAAGVAVFYGIGAASTGGGGWRREARRHDHAPRRHHRRPPPRRVPRTGRDRHQRRPHPHPPTQRTAHHAPARSSDRRRRDPRSLARGPQRPVNGA